MSRNLKLEVILQAVDKATAPLKKAMQSSSALAGTVKAAREQLKTLERDGARLETFRKLAKDASITGHQLAAAQAKVKDLSDAMAASEKPSKAMARDLAAAKKEAAALKDKSRDLASRQQTLRQALEAAGTPTRALARHQRELKERTQQASAALKAQEERLQKLSQQQARLAAARKRYDSAIATRDKIAGAGVSTMAAGGVVGAPMTKMVRDYVSFEDAMLGVARQVEGARDASGKLTAVYYEMGDAIKAMAERVPMATTEIAALVEGAARMGIQGKDNLLAFAKTAALASTAFDLPAEQISEDLGKIANIYKIPIKNIEQLGDVINYLDDNAQSKGADIINVMQRIAGSTGSMNFKEAAALGSTFLSLGASAEIAATATKAMVRELAIAEKQPKRFQSGLAELGLSPEAIQASMAKDSTGTIIRVLEAVKKLPEARRMGVMVDLFGKEYGDDAAKLADNLGEYRKQLALVRAEGATGSMAREGDAKNDTLSAQAQMLQNKLFNQSSGLGSTLRQPLMEIMATIGSVTDRVTAWTKANPELTATLVKAAAVIAAMLIASGGLMLAIAGIAGPFIMARFAIASFGTMLSSSIGILGKLGSSIGMIGRVIGMVGRLFLMSPIGLAVTAIALSALAIWKYWGPIKAFFAGLWAGVQQSTAAALAFLTGLPARFVAIGGQLMQGLARGIMAGLVYVKNAITGAGSAAIGWFKEKLGIHSPSRVFAELGGYTMDGLAVGLNKGAGAPLAAVAATAKRMAGVGLGVSMLAGQAAAVPLDARAPFAAGSAAAPITITIHAAPGIDERALARLVAVEVGKAQRQQAARGRARLTDRE